MKSANVAMSSRLGVNEVGLLLLLLLELQVHVPWPLVLLLEGEQDDHDMVGVC